MYTKFTTTLQLSIYTIYISISITSLKDILLTTERKSSHLPKLSDRMQ